MGAGWPIALYNRDHGTVRSDLVEPSNRLLPVARHRTFREQNAVVYSVTQEIFRRLNPLCWLHSCGGIGDTNRRDNSCTTRRFSER